MTVETCNSDVGIVEAAHRFKPDLILLDVMMPDVDGPTAFRQLQKVPELSSIPVVFITAKVVGGDITEFLELGAVDAISKPYDPFKLPEMVKEILSKSSP
jgi:two-component system OmpR family response regulator